MSIFNLEILKPDQALFMGKVTSVQVAALDGQVEVWARHAPFLTVLTPGKIKAIKDEQNQITIDSSEGILCVNNNTAKIYLT